MSDHKEYQTDLGGFCSPIIIYDPQKPEGEILDKIAQQIDIMPTVLGMLGYQKPYLAFGIDVLNTPAEDTWAVNYLNGVYQYVKHGEVIQFDGREGVRRQESGDRRQESGDRRQEMERELKAIIQQYMERMTQDRLKP